MRYKISQFDIEDKDGNKFFVETGEVFKSSTYVFGIVYRKKIIWTFRGAFKTINEAMDLINDIKKSQPTIHYVK